MNIEILLMRLAICGFAALIIWFIVKFAIKAKYENKANILSRDLTKLYEGCTLEEAINIIGKQPNRIEIDDDGNTLVSWNAYYKKTLLYEQTIIFEDNKYLKIYETINNSD